MSETATAIVTAAAHGIGLANATRLHADGFRVVAVDQDKDELDRCGLADDIDRVCFRIGDDPSALMARVGDLKPGSVLVNGVGVMDGRSFLELPIDAVEQAFAQNVFGQWKLTREFAGALLATGSTGAIVFILSLHTDRVRLCPDYSCSKAALLMLVHEMSSELGPKGIRVNAVSPGAVDTWSDRVPDPVEHRARSEAMVPLRRLGEPKDVAEAVAFLCDSDRASYITGANIKIDGGLDEFNWLHHMYGTAEAERSRLGSES